MRERAHHASVTYPVRSRRRRAISTLLQKVGTFLHNRARGTATLARPQALAKFDDAPDAVARRKADLIEPASAERSPNGDGKDFSGPPTPTTLVEKLAGVPLSHSPLLHVEVHLKSS